MLSFSSCINDILPKISNVGARDPFFLLRAKVLFQPFRCQSFAKEHRFVLTGTSIPLCRVLLTCASIVRERFASSISCSVCRVGLVYVPLLYRVYVLLYSMFLVLVIYPSSTSSCLLSPSMVRRFLFILAGAFVTLWRHMYKYFERKYEYALSTGWRLDGPILDVEPLPGMSAQFGQGLSFVGHDRANHVPAAVANVAMMATAKKRRRIPKHGLFLAISKSVQGNVSHKCTIALLQAVGCFDKQSALLVPRIVAFLLLFDVVLLGLDNP